MKKSLISVIVAALSLGTLTPALALPLTGSPNISVTSKSTTNTAVTDAVAEVTWNSADGLTYSVAAVATGNDTKFGSTPTCVSGSCTSLVTGLQGGVAYSVYVSAVNASGTKYQSDPVSFTARSVPSEPTPLTAVVSGNEATLTWTAPSNTGGLALGDYSITGGPTVVTAGGTSTTAVVKGLVYGTPYSFKISASNSLGSSGSVDFPKSVTAVSVPDAPAAPVATADGTTIKVNWSAPKDNGAAINGYKVYLLDDQNADVGNATSVAAGSLTANIDNLSTGTYTVKVVASNSQGDSPRSAASGAVGVTAGTPPAIGSASIVGTARVGEVLTAVAASVSGSPTPKATYQWKRAGAAIAGETSSTYTVLSTDLGKTISVTITETNGIGTPATATSAATAAVVPVDEAANIGSVVISGSAKVGRTLSASPVGVTGYPVPTTTYQWSVDGQVVQSANTASYTVLIGDLGKTITVTATATNTGGHVTVTSTPTSAVLPADVAPAIAGVTISGTARVGQTLTAVDSGVTGSPSPNKTYLWKRGTSTISGATGASYTLVTADLNKAITVKVTVTNVAGSANRTSAPTVSVIAQYTPATSVSASITGTATVGQTLTAVASSEGAAPAPTYSYVWKRNGTAIPGATSSTYTLITADLAATISVVVTAANDYGSLSGTSGNTSAVAAAPVVDNGGSSNNSGGGSSGGSSGGSAPTTPSTEPVTTTPVVLDSSNPTVKQISSASNSLFPVSLSFGAGTPVITGIQIAVPAGAAPVGAKLSVAPAVSAVEAASGLLTLNVQITDASGSPVTKLDKPLELTLGKLSLAGLTLAYSADGMTWHQIASLSGTTLPAGVSEGYFIDASGNVVVLTTHLTYFGTKKTQSTLTATLASASDLAGHVVLLSTSGGSGSGSVSAVTSTPEVCSVAYGKVALLSPGLCQVAAVKNGDGSYLNANSSTVSVVSLAAITKIVKAGKKRSISIQASLAFAGKPVVVQMQSNAKAKWVKLFSANLNNVAQLTKAVVVASNAKVRVLSGSKVLTINTVK